MQDINTPFHTGNIALAFALYCGGNSFNDKSAPCCNIYDAETLRQLGFSGDAFTAAQEAFSKNKNGKVQYAFEITPKTGSLIEAFNDQKKKVDESDATVTAAEMLLSIAADVQAGTIDSAEGLVRMSCVFSTARKMFLRLWRNVEPQVMLHKSGARLERNTPRGKVVTHPGFVTLSAFATSETKAKFGL
jgi:hypothetical protein